jgi:hypothetical protein
MNLRNRTLAAIYLCLALDAMGIGLVFPILPALVQQVTHTSHVAPVIGVMAALYAALQLVCAPVLGALSDRLGRRPVLLLSMAGSCARYLLLACAPSLLDQRARRFGLFNAMSGAGFIAGPVLGGMLGDPRNPEACCATTRCNCRHWLTDGPGRVPYSDRTSAGTRGRCLPEHEDMPMAMVTTEHRLRCSDSDSCWVTLQRNDQWAVVSVELAGGEVLNVSPDVAFDTEDEALAHARGWVCQHSGKQFE